MRLLSLTAVLAGTATLSAVVALADDSQETAIRSVISKQLRAFQTDNLAKAFSYASPAVKGRVGDLDRFAQMVRSRYPMVWRSSDVTFLGATEIDDGYVQRVMIKDEQGRVHLLDYEMIESFSGWQINGVTLLKLYGTA